ncbi:unnamed protein product [Prorocentrum cordatum]|uniref:Uncharacterized protein n=1 Tax=Prorocentrum cordatum TaxID=2364126 RepID=A0ABN9R338_9DINO|nr:unnamed protein product [Polarella glacialis]
MLCWTSALPRLGLWLLLCRAAALSDDRQLRASAAAEPDRAAAGPAALQDAPAGEGGASTLALLQEVLADQGAALDPEQQARWRRYPHSIVAASLSHQGAVRHGHVLRMLHWGGRQTTRRSGQNRIGITRNL